MEMIFIGPSAFPSVVMVTDVTSTTITVQWKVVPCIHQNGAITGYSVRYGVAGSGITQTDNTTEREIVISALSTSTNYSVEVAAVNSAGTGDYSSPIFATTDSKIISTITINLQTSSSFLGGISLTVVSAIPTAIVIK